MDRLQGMSRVCLNTCSVKSHSISSLKYYNFMSVVQFINISYLEKLDSMNVKCSFYASEPPYEKVLFSKMCGYISHIITLHTAA